MAQVTIICEGTRGKFPRFVLMAPLKESSKPQIMAKSENSKTSSGLYSYAIIHCKRLNLDHFWDENKKVEIDSIIKDTKKSAQMEPGTWS